jgi:hypothetical protein
MLNFNAVPPVGIVLTNVLLDLYSAPSCKEFVGALREECDEALAASDGTWTKDAVSRLCRVDSTIRESMRFSNFGTLALPRRVS